MRVTALAVAAAVTCGLLTGCDYTDAADNDFCTQYADVVTSAQQLLALNPGTDDVTDLRARADDFETQLAELQAVSEDRLNSAISSLRTAVDDLVASAVDSDTGAIIVTRPALEDAHDEIKKAWSVVELMALHECAEA